MAVSFTEKTAISQYDNANSTTFNTPSLTATANKLYLVLIQVSYSASRTLSSVSGGGLGTWNIITGADIENTAVTRRVCAAWATSASPGAAAAIAIAFSGATTGCAYEVWEIDGHAASPIGNVNAVRSTGVSTLAPSIASGTSGSGIIASCQTVTNEAMTGDGGGGWTSGENNTGSSPSVTVLSQYRTDISDLAATFTWTTAGTCVANIVEILAGAAGVTVEPGLATLTTARFTPTVSTPRLVTPGLATLTTTRFTPAVSTPRLATPGKATLTTTRFTPTVTAPQLSVPGLATLTTTRFTPTVTVVSGTTLTPGTASLITTRFTPTVQTPRTVTPGTRALTTTRFTPAVLTPRLVTPQTASLTLTRFASTVTVGAAISVTPGTASLVTTRYTPSVVIGGPVVGPSRLQMTVGTSSGEPVSYWNG